jgi:hypothetical protein
MSPSNPVEGNIFFKKAHNKKLFVCHAAKGKEAQKKLVN